MKAIQITVDDRLLARIDADPDVKRLGRSAVFRLAVDAYLRQRRRRAITNAYQKAYGKQTVSITDLEAWSDEGVWPEP